MRTLRRLALLVVGVGVLLAGFGASPAAAEDPIVIGQCEGRIIPLQVSTNGPLPEFDSGCII